MRPRKLVIISALAVVLLGAATTLAIVVGGGDFNMGNGNFRNPGRTRCIAPALPGAVVNVSLTDMGGPMMGGPGMGGGRRGGMALTADRASVPHGPVSFAATNFGSINHELVILPLRDGRAAGTRPQRDDSTIDETSSIGEASNACGSGTGDGIAPATSSWTTVTLAPGRYELVCNLPGHYAAGMYTQLTVR